jgi:hypothetical protein
MDEQEITTGVIATNEDLKNFNYVELAKEIEIMCPRCKQKNNFKL